MAVLKVTNRVLSIGGKIIQISNIAEANIVKDRNDNGKGFGAIFFGIILFCIAFNANSEISVIFYLACVACFWLAYTIFQNKYILLLQTSAGRITPLKSENISLLEEIIKNLHDAMSHEPVNYSIEISDSIIMESQIGNIGNARPQNERR